MGGDGGFGNMFNDPGMYGKLAANPKTAAFMRDPQFLAKLERLKKNPADMGAELGDQRILTAMGVLLGVDMSFGGPPEGGKAAGGGRDEDGDEDMPDLRPATSAPPSKKAPEPAPSAPEPEPVDEEALAQQKAKAAADEEKKLGTENYKKRQFDEAIAHYEKAWELHKDITYLTNLGAAKFEKKDYEGAIAACSTAVTEGREMLADFKLVAKAYGRMGSSYEKMGDLGLAIENYQRALTEHRTPDILTKLRAAEKAKVIADRNAYVDPAQAEAARELGNQKFKDAEWPAAVEAYSEMTRRAPDDPRGYSNRAACLIKLLSFPAAVTDCDEAIRRDPAFVRAYLRKAQALFAMREYSRCIDVCAEAHEHDGEGRNAREIDAQQQKALSAQFTAQEGETEEQTSERIQRDPEIMSILQGMSSVGGYRRLASVVYPCASADADVCTQIPSCSPSCNRPRATPRRCRTTCRTRASVRRSRSSLPRASSSWAGRREEGRDGRERYTRERTTPYNLDTTRSSDVCSSVRNLLHSQLPSLALLQDLDRFPLDISQSQIQCQSHL